MQLNYSARSDFCLAHITWSATVRQKVHVPLRLYTASEERVAWTGHRWGIEEEIQWELGALYTPFLLFTLGKDEGLMRWRKRVIAPNLKAKKLRSMCCMYTHFEMYTLYCDSKSLNLHRKEN